jgi:hypothetical protein
MHASNPYVIEVNGLGFEVDEQTPIYTMTSIGLVEPYAGRLMTCSVVESSVIVSGGFAFRLENLTDDAVYPSIGAYLDRDRDGRCSPSDPKWGTTSVILDKPAVINVDPSKFQLADPHYVCAQFAQATAESR